MLILIVVLVSLSGYTASKGKESITDVSFINAIDLSGEWRFKKIEFIDQSMIQPEYNDSSWPTVQVPATWDKQGIEWGAWDIPLVLYRRIITIPAEWEGKLIGISCWFSKQSVVYVNGVRVEPKGPLFARYGDVSKILRYGKANYIAVTALNEGKLVLAESGSPRLGILEKRLVTKVLREDITIPADDRKINATLFRPTDLKGLPGLILVATAHYGWGVTEPWFDFADELARKGYASLILGATTPRLEYIPNAIDYLSMLDFIDPARIGVIGADEAAKLSIVAASQDPRIKTVISLSSPRIKFNDKVSLCPVLLIVSENDTSAMIYAKKISKELSEPPELLVFKGKAHGITFIEEKSITRQAILDWLKKYL